VKRWHWRIFRGEGGESFSKGSARSRIGRENQRQKWDEGVYKKEKRKTADQENNLTGGVPMASRYFGLGFVRYA